MTEEQIEEIVEKIKTKTSKEKIFEKFFPNINLKKGNWILAIPKSSDISINESWIIERHYVQTPIAVNTDGFIL